MSTSKITHNNAASAATGSNLHCISWDMIDMSKIPTLTGKRYCMMMVERKTRFAHIVLYDSNDEKTIIVKSDCASEYHTITQQSWRRYSKTCTV